MIPVITGDNASCSIERCLFDGVVVVGYGTGNAHRASFPLFDAGSMPVSRWC
jgi:hypothetical protein